MGMIWLVWTLSVAAVIATEDTSRDTRLDIALSFARHFKVSFCVFGRSDERKDFGFISSKFYPSKNELLTGFLNFQEISDLIHENLIKNHGGKAMIVLDMESSTLTHLSQLSLNGSLSSVVWIMFSNSSFRPELFRDIYVPFDCEFIYVSETDSVFLMTEIYQIGEDTEMETYDLGHWTKETGLVLSGLHVYYRRNNLKGHRLKGIIKNSLINFVAFGEINFDKPRNAQITGHLVQVPALGFGAEVSVWPIQNPPYVSIESDVEGKPKFKGYLYEIWNELEHRLNFRTEFPEGYFDKDPGEVLKNGEVDVAVARISPVPFEFDNFDFSHPIHEAKSYMFGHRPGSELDWDSYLKPFSPNTWFVSILWLFSSSLALTILYRKAWDFGTAEREASYYVFTFPESLLTVFRAICMQGSDITPRSNSCRLFFLSIYLTALVVTSAFSAALFSLLTIPKPRSPFNSLDEVLNDHKFKIGFPSNSDFQELVEEFSSTLAESKQQKLLEKLRESRGSHPKTPQQGLLKICEDKFYVFVFDLPKVLYLMQDLGRSCQDKILPSGPPLFTELISLGFKKKNPYKELINFHLIRMMNEGILKRLLLNYWPPQIPMVQASWVRVTLSDISPILYMFAFGAVLGTIFLQVEKIVLHFVKRRRKKRALNPPNVSGRLLLDQPLPLSGLHKTKSFQWGSYY